MSKFESLYEVGEERLISLMKQPQYCRSNIDGLSQTIHFNEKDHYSSLNGIIQFYLCDEKYTFTTLVNLVKNVFSISYYENEKIFDEDSDIFYISRIPYDITEEWHFQISTLKEFPVTYEFITYLRKFIQYFEDMMNINHSIEVQREVYNIVPYPSG